MEEEEFPEELYVIRDEDEGFLLAFENPNQLAVPGEETDVAIYKLQGFGKVTAPVVVSRD